jgi:threonine dehydratase
MYRFGAEAQPEGEYFDAAVAAASTVARASGHLFVELR